MVTLSHANASSLREADLCFALADPKRVEIVHALEKHPYNVNELTAELGLPQPMTSRHLKILRERGLVHSTRHGVSITYSLSDLRLIQALELLKDISNKYPCHSERSEESPSAQSDILGGFHEQ
jgi:DNA-binding transcriptional ArsR family regulator